MQKLNSQILVTKEPGGSELGEKIRNIVLNSQELSTRAEILLFLADRAEHYAKIIEPNKNKIILSDRGFISGIAYAKAKNDNLDILELLKLNEFALKGDLKAKFVFFKASEELILSRLKTRGSSDEIEKRGVKYLIAVQEIMSIILRDLKFETLEIDASQSIERIHEKIRNFI